MSRRSRRRRQRSIPIYIFPVVIVAMGFAALILSIALPGSASGSESTPAAAIFDEPVLDLSTLDEPVVSTAKRLTSTEAPPGAAPQASQPPPKPKATLPVIKSAPPSEALPAVQVKGLSSAGRGASVPDSVARGGGVTSNSSAASTSGAYSVVIVPEGPAALQGVALDLAGKLKSKGIEARVASLDDAGRPDALLMLGEASTATSETWFCDPGPEASAKLAKKLLHVGGAALAPGPEASGPQTDLPCDDVHAGRARVAAVLLELPQATIERRDNFNSTADGVATGISRYFSENAVSVKSARAAAKLAWPASGPITSYYGPSHPLGIDIGQFNGPINAATNGTVVFAGGDPCCSYGRYVVIKSPEGIETLYAHLSSIAVKKGQKVKQGQVLGVEGCTGHCSGPHLHFEVYDQGKRQNPMLYLP